MQKMKQYLGEILTTIGVAISSYNIFNFSYMTYGKGGLLPELPGSVELEGIAYYYDSNTLLLITIGTILVTIGILIIKNKK